MCFIRKLVIAPVSDIFTYNTQTHTLATRLSLQLSLPLIL